MKEKPNEVVKTDSKPYGEEIKRSTAHLPESNARNQGEDHGENRCYCQTLQHQIWSLFGMNSFLPANKVKGKAKDGDGEATENEPNEQMTVASSVRSDRLTVTVHLAP